MAALLLVGSLAVPVHADPEAAGLLQRSTFSTLVPVPVSGLALTQVNCPGTTSPGALAIDAVANTFRWSETDVGQTPAGQAPGMTTKGCATVAFTIDVPPGSDDVALSFSAGREVTCGLSVPPTPINPGGPLIGCPRFQQSITLNGTAGGAVTFDYYNVSEPAHDVKPVLGLQPLPLAGQARLHGVWLFREGDSSIDPALAPVRPNGAAYAATIASPLLQFQGIAAPPSSVTFAERRAGTALLQDVEVAVPVPSTLLESGLGPDLTVRFDPRLGFQEVRAPDGDVLVDRVTRQAVGPFGFDRSKLLLERDGNSTQITVSAELLRAHGAGTYVVVESQELHIQAVPALVPLAALLLVVPFPFAGLAAIKTRAFEKQAFGGFRRSARNLRLALLIVTLYYLAVVGAALLAGGVDDMTRLPLAASAWFLYLQLLLAAAAFGSLYLVARELHGITVPKSVPEESP